MINRVKAQIDHELIFIKGACERASTSLEADDLVTLEHHIKHLDEAAQKLAKYLAWMHGFEAGQLRVPTQ